MSLFTFHDSTGQVLVPGSFDPPEEIVAAVHEAGHAVVYCAFSGCVEVVTIQEGNAYCRGFLLSSSEETDMAINIAGLAAQMIHLRVPCLGAASADRDQVSKNFEKLGRLDRRTRHETIRMVWGEVVRTLLEPASVQAVSMLADRLLEKATLDATEVNEIIVRSGVHRGERDLMERVKRWGQFGGSADLLPLRQKAWDYLLAK